MRTRPFLAVLLFAVAACSATVPSAEPTTPSLEPASPPPATPDPSPVATEAATLTPAETAEAPDPDPASFLQVCHRFAGTSDGDPVACGQAVKAALEASDGAGLPSRIDVRFACASAPACEEQDPGRVFVTLVAGGAATELELRLADDGTLAVVDTRAGRLPPIEPFDPPAPALADLGDAPPAISSRAAYPLCGEELVEPDGGYDVAARRCFLAGVLAGSPVELALRGAGTEGAPFVTLFRFGGAGGIERIDGEGGSWTRAFSGIAPVDGDEVFELDGIETPPAPVP